MNFPKLDALEPYSPGIGGCSIHLDANESCYDLPEDLKAKVAYEIAQLGFHRYPDALASGVCEAFARFYQLPAKFVTAGNGSDELISVLFNAFMPRGGRVLMCEPDFSMYRFYCALAECEPVVLRKNENLSFTAQQIIALAEQTKPDMIIFSNPCNPTGQGISREDVLKIVRAASCLVVADEAYMDFWDQPVLQDAPQYENLMVLKTCSKVGLAAIRLGFAVANEHLTALLRAAKSPYNVDSLTQAAGQVVLEAPGYLADRAKSAVALKDSLYEKLWELVENKKADARVFATHTNFVAVKTPLAARLHEQLLKKGISVRFMKPDLLRITAGSEDENAALLAALCEIL